MGWYLYSICNSASLCAPWRRRGRVDSLSSKPKYGDATPFYGTTRSIHYAPRNDNITVADKSPLFFQRHSAWYEYESAFGSLLSPSGGNLIHLLPLSPLQERKVVALACAAVHIHSFNCTLEKSGRDNPIGWQEGICQKQKARNKTRIRITWIGVMSSRPGSLDQSTVYVGWTKTLLHLFSIGYDRAWCLATGVVLSESKV